MLLFLLLGCASKRSEVPLLLAKTSDSVLYVGALSPEPATRARAFELILSTASGEELSDWLPKAASDPEAYVRRSSLAAALEVSGEELGAAGLGLDEGDRCWLGLHSVWSGAPLPLPPPGAAPSGSEDRLLCALWEASSSGDFSGISGLVRSEVLPGTRTFYLALGRSGLQGLSGDISHAVDEGEDFTRLPLLCAWAALDDAAAPRLRTELAELDALDRMDAVDLLGAFEGETVSRLLRQIASEGGPSGELAGLVLVERRKRPPRAALRLLEESADRDMKARSALALGRWLAGEESRSAAGERVESALVSLLSSEEPALRASAARALGESGRWGAVRHLQKMEEERLDVQLEIVGAIRGLAYAKSS